MEAGAESDQVSAEDRATYRSAADLLRKTIAETKVVGRMKHPNNADLKNCYLRLAFSDVLADFDLGQKSILGFPVDRGFDIVARFEIKFEDITGVELQERIEKQRDQWLVEDIRAGDVVETVRIAKLTRREFKIKEPEFVNINYDTSFVAETNIPKSFLGK